MDATFLIGGFYVANLLWSLVLKHELGVSKPLRTIWGVLTFGLFIGIGLSQGILLILSGSSQGCTGNACPWYFSIDFGEWFILFVIMADFAILLFLLPERFGTEKIAGTSTS